MKILPWRNEKKTMKNFATIICLALILLPLQSIAQSRSFFDDSDDFRRIRIGLGAGGFFAGRHPANFYNGRRENENTIGNAWKNTVFMDNIRGRLQDRYGSENFEVYEFDLPERMRYRIATAVSFRASLHVSRDASIFFNFNHVNLTATDVFFLTVPHPIISQPIRVESRIWGREARTMLDVGFQWVDDLYARNWQWFYELGVNVTNTRVRENMIEIEGLRHTIMNQGRFLNPGWSTVETPESAWGIGILGAFGFRYVINPTASLDFGATAYLHDINLPGYTRFHMSFNIFARLNFLMF